MTAKAKNIPGIVDGTTAAAGARKKQAEFLFRKLSRLRTSNGASVEKASYYHVCPARETGFDTGLHEAREVLPSGSTDCLSSNLSAANRAKRRSEIVDLLDSAIH